MVNGKSIISLSRQFITLNDNRFYHQHLRVSKMFPNVADFETAKTKKTVKCKSQVLLNKLGMIHGSSAGIFMTLPFLSRALDKLYTIVNDEMRSIGGQKVSLPCLSNDTPWKLSGRWDEMGSELFTLSDRNDVQHCLSPTHEESVTSLVARYSPVSYKQLPLLLYQIGRKFRDERRPKNGLLRGREFDMKDMYSFDANLDDATVTYEKVCEAYSKIFAQLGLNVLQVDGSVGSMGGIKSKEFHLRASAGEDQILSCPSCGVNVNSELLINEEDNFCDCESVKKRSTCIEIAHAFLLGTKYSEVFEATCKHKDNSCSPLVMGCYGIGITRLIAASLEYFSSDSFIKWPRLIAPYQVMVIPQKKGFCFTETLLLAEGIQKDILNLPNMHYEAVLDDRHDLSIGRRLQYAMSLGYPYALVVGKEALQEEPLFELVSNYQSKRTSTLHSKSDLLKVLSKVKTITSSS